MKVKLFFVLMMLARIAFGQQPDSIYSDKSNLLSANINETRDFIKKYNLAKSKTFMARVLDKCDLHSTPDLNSPKTGVVVYADSIIYVYKYFPNERSWIARFHGQWGFIADSKVFPISKRTHKVSKYDEPPQLRTGINPVYPEEAKEKGITGRVYIKVFINKKGKATKTIILKGYPELNQAAIDAVMKAKYKPAKYQKEKVGVWITLSLIFKQ
jgi:TonB family protein